MSQVKTTVRISKSQIDTFLSCAYKWYLQYKRGIRAKTTEIGPASLGDAVHFGIAAALRSYWSWHREYYPIGYAHLDSMIDLAIEKWDAENRPTDKNSVNVSEDGKEFSLVPDAEFYDKWCDMLENARQIVKRTIREIKLLEKYDVVDVRINDKGLASNNGYFKVDAKRVPLIEHQITIQVPDTDFEFSGIVDAVLRNRDTGMVEVIDWKVRRTFTGMDAEVLNAQIGLYQYALSTLGVDTQVGVIYQIKNEAPKTPTLNKDGTMSRRKIITDWFTYEKALLAEGLDPAEYADMREKLIEVEFYRPIMVIRTQAVTDALWSNMVEHARRISDEKRFPRSYGYPCRHCPFNLICQGELYGYDVDEIIASNYEVVNRPQESEEDNE